MRAGRLSIFCAAVLVLCSSGNLFAEKLSMQLQAVMKNATAGDKIPVIITFPRRADISRFANHPKRSRRLHINRALRSRAARTQRPVRQLLRDNRAQNLKSLWMTNKLAVEVDAQLVNKLARMPQIETILLDETIHLPEVTNVRLEDPQWNIEMIGAPALWRMGVTGEGIVVATIDSGVDIDHPALGDNWRGGANSWYDVRDGQTVPYDDNGHGTQVMGVIAGAAGVGVAPGLRWIAAKVFDRNNNGTASDVHLALQWVLDPDNDPNTDDAPDIVSNSWNLRDTTGQCIDEFADDIRTLRAAGIAVVFAAGNDGPYPASGPSPANYADTLSVGAINADFQIALFSSRGPSACHNDIFPNLVAPGLTITTTDLSFGGMDNYATVNGTSFAAPHAAGAMALLMAAFGEAGVEDIQHALQQTALDMGETGPDYDYGYGCLDVAAAWEFLREQNHDCHPDTDGIDTDGNGVIDDDNVCVNLTARNDKGDYEFQFSGDAVDSEASVVRLRQGQKLYLKFTNPDDFGEALSIGCLGLSPAVPVFSGSAMCSFSILAGAQFTYFYNADQPGTYPLIAASQTGQFYPVGKICVEPMQNVSLADGTELIFHIHRHGDRYARNDGDGSTYYDVEYSLTPGDCGAHEINVQKGQRIFLRITGGMTETCTLRSIGMPMTVIAKGPGTQLHYKTNTLTIHSGQSTDIILDTQNIAPGTHLLYTMNRNDLCVLAQINIFGPL
jgi:bacillopeptidase F